MGYYIQSSDLQAAIPATEWLQLTDRADPQDGVADAAVVTAAIEAGENRLHAYVARRYALPLNATDAILLGFIKPMILDFAWAALFAFPEMLSKPHQSRIDGHIKTLEAIRDGVMDLPAAAPPAATAGATQVQWSAPERKFGKGLP